MLNWEGIVSENRDRTRHRNDFLKHVNSPVHLLLVKILQVLGIFLGDPLAEAKGEPVIGEPTHVATAKRVFVISGKGMPVTVRA